MKVIHGIEWDDIEIENFIKIVRSNFVVGMQEALDVAKKVNVLPNLSYFWNS